MADENPFAKYAKEPVAATSPASTPAPVPAGDNPFAKYARPIVPQPGEQVYYNDANQPFTMRGAITQPQPQDKSYTGAVLPLRTDEGGTHLAVPRMISEFPTMAREMVEAPVRGVISMAERGAPFMNQPVDPKGRELQNPLRPLSDDELAGAMTVGGLRAPGAPSAKMMAPATAAAKRENEARRLVSNRFTQGAAVGAPNVVDVMERMAAARTEKQPYTLSDLENTELKSLAGTTYRQGGPARQEMNTFYAERDKAQRGRMQSLLKTHLTDESMMETGDELAALRSNTGRAYWNEALQGGSLAPLEQQYQSAWVKAGQDEQAALQQLNQAQQAVTNAAAKKATAGNVYSTSAANDTMREAMLKLRQAEDALRTAQSDKELTLNKMQTAQIDRATNAPGGIWSPYLERQFQQPEIKQGLRHGVAIQRRDAVGENQPFNVKEYALDEKGNVIGVPNMRTWAVAKKGLDAIISQRLKKEVRFPGDRPSESTVSYMKLRDGLVGELDRLNPTYKAAREHWGGYTASIRALNDGKAAFREAKFTPEELQRHVNSLSEGDKQFFLVGVADELRTKLRRAGDTADKSKIINEDARERLKAIFQNDEQASRFMDAVEREAQMKQTPQKIHGGSQTAERTSDDLMQTVGHGLRSAWHLAHGNPVLGASYGLRTLGEWLAHHPNQQRNEAVARLLTNPDIADLIASGNAQRGGALLPPKSVPRGYGFMSRAAPGLALGSQISDPSTLLPGEQPR